MPVVNVNGVNLYYQVHGSGEPLILISGLGADRKGCSFQLRHFKKFYRVVVFDNRGIGRSDKPVRPYTIRDMAADTVGLMDHLKMDQANVLGVSMGGMIAQEMALNHPQRLKRVILASTGANGWESAPNAKMSRALGVAEVTQQINWDGINWRKAMIAITSLSFNGWAYRFFMTSAYRVLVRPPMLRGVSGQMRAIGGHNTVDRLPLIKCPTLVIGGTKDWIFPRSALELLGERIPGARLVLLEGANHAMSAECHRRFNGEVGAFLRSV
jgi:3-oxoadipate enol-lactonase